MKISLVIYELGCGGAERVMTILANELASRGHDLTIHVMNPCEPFFELDKKVKIKFVGGITPRGAGLFIRISGLFLRNRLLKESITSAGPDVVLSFIDEMNARTLLALKGTGIPVVVSERTYPPMHKISWFYSKVRRRFYPHAAAVVVQTEAAADWARGWIPEERIKIIPNPVKKHTGDATPPDWMRGSDWILSMGRLSHEKGFDLLIEAFSLISAKCPQWKLVIMGEGPEQDALQSLIEEKKLQGKVSLKKPVRDASGVLAGSSIYVLCSRFEGFPNALCEAMAGGLPAVAFNCKAGPSDIVIDGTDGILVQPGDVSGLARGLELLMSDEKQRRFMGENARNVSERFSYAHLMDVWEKLLTNCSRVI